MNKQTTAVTAGSVIQHNVVSREQVEDAYPLSPIHTGHAVSQPL